MMPILPSNQTVSPLGQLAPNQQSNMPQINPDLIEALRKFAMAAMMSNSATGGTIPQNQQQPPQPQQQQVAQSTNPGLGGLSFPNMNPANTGLTPDFGAQIGGALKKGLFGG